MTKIKCVIAAGGLGTRLQDFRQNDKTKILLEVNGIPMINRQIYQINQWGIEEFIIITNPDFDELIRNVTSKEFPNLNINYSIQETPKGISHAFSKAENFIASSEYGASIFFTGTVRIQNNNQIVTGITYDSHDEMVIKSFKEIYNETEHNLNIKDKAVFIEHAKGYLNIGEISIIIAVACKHRDEAYILSRYIIEEIKKRSPIWKKEHYNNNESAWLKGNPIIHEKN